MDRRQPRLITTTQAYVALVIGFMTLLTLIGTPILSLRDDVRDLKSSEARRVTRDALIDQRYADQVKAADDVARSQARMEGKLDAALAIKGKQQ